MTINTSIIPHNETQRMAAVKSYDILDTPSDGSFDRITAIAARRFKVPIAIISIVDHDRIWFKSHHGVPVDQIDREPGLCASAILNTEPYILLDAKTDPRSLTNPLVAGEMGLRFYAGVPLQTQEGYNLGTLCVIDTEPRPIDQDQIEDLKDLASVVMDQMELRISARRAVAREQLLRQEIDHRVMNSLQFVSTLLTLQSRDPSATDGASELEAAASRISAVAQVHRNFYAHNADEISCLSFLNGLCKDLSAIIGRPISVSGDEGQGAASLIQPIGLIVNELVTNAAKYSEGTIEVSYRINGAGARELSVSDQGSGLPEGFDPARNAGGLGMRMVTSLAEQLQGHVSAGPNPAGHGARFTVTFPA